MTYFLAQDGSGHWYLVDASRRKDWETWTAIPDDQPAAWTPPPFASALGGSPSIVEFKNPLFLSTV